MKLALLSGALALAVSVGAAAAQPGLQPTARPYSVVRTARVGGEGGFDYVYADIVNRRLYVPRGGDAPRITVFNLDTLAPAGEIAGANARGTAVDPASGHGFASSKPVVMWDARSLAKIRTIDVQGNPDGILFDPFNQRVYVLSHSAPNVTVIDSKSGGVVGTLDLGGAPEQAASDGKGRIYIDLEDKGQVAVVDAATLTVKARLDLGGPDLAPAGLALDARNHVLFVACRNPASMIVLNADTGKILATLPIGAGVDGAAFNPATMEAFSSQRDGTLTVIKETSPTRFAVEQIVRTMVSAKTLTLDSKTGRILLIGAEFGPPPPSDVPGGRPRRGAMLPGSFSIIAVGK